MEVPHHCVVSIVEVKALYIDGRSQVASYAFQLLEARPDLPGAYIAWASPQGYQILWSDTSGVVASEFTSWDDITLLGAYVYSLYRPPSLHYLRDRSIKPMKEGFQPEDDVLWEPEVREYGRSFPMCKSLFVGNSWGRRTNIFKCEDSYATVVIKDSYRDIARRYFEEKLLYKIHKYGIYPGVVRPLFSPPLSTGEKHSKVEPLPVNVPGTAPLDDEASSDRDTARLKTRLIMGSYGEPLDKAGSVLDILKVFYDAIEGMPSYFKWSGIAVLNKRVVHRGLVMKRKVLHRDISFYNILINPVHNPEAMSGKELRSDGPFFIDDVLRGKGEKCVISESLFPCIC